MNQLPRLTAKRKGVRRLLEGKVEGGHRYQEQFSWENIAFLFKSHVGMFR
jgi:hypothetical protein